MMNWVIITGASRGIGLATAELFLQSGWQVISIARTPCPQPQVQSLQLDLAMPNLTQALQQQLVPKLASAKRIYLIHNAALLAADATDTLTAGALQQVLAVNVIAPAVLNQVLVPYMQAGSSILYVGSTLAEMAITGRASYVMTKHAMVGMMRAACQDLADKKIHTACVCPGFTDTEMLRSHIPDEATRALLSSRVGENRLISPQEIADILYFCAHHSALNGSVLHANLGQKNI